MGIRKIPYKFTEENLWTVILITDKCVIILSKNGIGYGIGRNIYMYMYIHMYMCVYVCIYTACTEHMQMCFIGINKKLHHINLFITHMLSII